MRIYNLKFSIYNLKQSLFPLKGLFLDDVEETDQKQYHENDHFDHALDAQLPEVDGPRVKEDHLYVKKHEKNGDQKVFYRKRDTGITDRFDSALEVFILVLGMPFRAQLPRNDNGSHYKSDGQQRLHDYREII